MTRVQPSPSPTAIELAGPAMIDGDTAVTSQVGPWGMVPAWVLQAKGTDGRGLSGADLRVYVAMRSFADRDGKAFPHVKTLADRADVSQRTAERSIGRLREMGLIWSKRRHRGDGSISRCDYVLIDIQPGPSSVSAAREVLMSPMAVGFLDLGPEIEPAGPPVPVQRRPGRRDVVSRPAARNVKDRRTCVYRHFDADGALLYVGITSSSSQRESGHLLNSLWHGMSASRTEEWFPNRAAAEAAEVKAIADEEPLFNIEGNASTRALLRVRRYLEARDLGALWEIHRRRVEFGQRPAHTRKAKAPTGKVLAVIEDDARA